MPRRRPTYQGEPAHLVVDNEALVAYDDELTRMRAIEAGQLRVRSHHGTSVVDAHVAAAALAAIRRHGDTATVATSDVDNIERLLDATDDRHEGIHFYPSL